MDAREFFDTVVAPNCEKFHRNPDDLRLLWNAVVSMNSMAEFLALEQLAYEEISRADLDRVAKELRAGMKGFAELKFCAETFKHVRKIKDHGKSKFSTISTSTVVSISDHETWTIGPHNVPAVLRQAYASVGAVLARAK
jgi:hypothetical protein